MGCMPMTNESTFINNSMDEDSHLHEGAIIHQTPIKQNIPHFLKEINVYQVLFALYNCTGLDRGLTNFTDKLTL